MATIEAYQTKSGRRYQVRYRTQERTQTKRRGFKTKRDAEKFAAEVEVAINAGDYVSPSAARVTVGELGPEWLERKRTLKPSYLRSLRTAWRVHVEPRWGSVAVGDVTATAVQAWVTELSVGKDAKGATPPVRGKSATIVARAHGVLAGILDDAVKDRRARTNVARGVALPRKTRKSRTYLNHAQVAALAGQCGEHATFVYVLAYCGLRWGEATGLRVRHIDFLRRRLAIEENAVEDAGKVIVGTPKTHERRSVPFPAFLCELLAAACEGKGHDDLVFARPDGTHMLRPKPKTRTNSGGWFESAVRRAGIPRVTPHDLRHTAASLAVSAGANVKAVQKMLGHKSAAMTLDVYAYLFDSDLDSVAGRLDEAREKALKRAA